MGRADGYQFEYLDDNRRFADQVNGALFQGRQLVKPDELEPADMQIVYHGEEDGKPKEFKSVVDKIRMWRGKLLHILVIENQTYVDYHMVLRNMLTECLSYHNQWKKRRGAHIEAGDLRIGTDAFFSGMTKDEKFMPVITLVVYCGMEHPWDGAKSLHELLEIDEELKPFVTDYRLNLYDCHEHDSFDEYHTGLRQLFEVVRYGMDKEKLWQVIEQNREAYSRLDNDTRKLLEVVAKVRIKEEEVMESGEKRYDLCKAFVDMKLEGIEEGKEKGKEEGKQYYLVRTVCIKLKKNKCPEAIAEELEEELSEIEKVIAAQKKVGNYDVEQICTAMME